MGFIYIVIIIIGALIHSVNEIRKNKRNKMLYKSSDETYIDIKGKIRMISNNEIVFYTRDKNKDYVLEDTHGNVYKNFSKEKRDKEIDITIKNAKKNNESTYCIDEDNHIKDWVCKGKRFKDFNTGDIYVIRYIKHKYYYMNISNGLLERKTDWQIKQDELKKDNKNLNLHEEINIEEFNEAQKCVQNQSLLYRDFDYNFSCDYNK